MSDLTELQYFLVKVESKIEDPKSGKIKKLTETYLVNAVNVTDCEVQIHEEYKNAMMDWSINSVTATKIIKVIEPAKSSSGRRPA